MTRFGCGLLLALLALDVTFLASPAARAADARNTLTRPGDVRYRPSRHPDRVVLVPGADAAREVAINWRTESRVETTVVQWTRALDSPGLHVSAATATGQSRLLKTRNGIARHHSVRLANLTPDTLYAYRVGGGDTWSEWIQFRTAAAEFAPFSFLYFGDAQNSVRSHFSRVIRGGFRDAPGISLILHAGDLVNQGNGNHDDEWGEWFEAGGFLHSMIATLPVAGNHEYVSRRDSTGASKRVLGPHWPRQFSPPRNGPAGFEDTVFFVYHSGVLFVVLDSMRALEEPEAAEIQARWLDELLTRDQSRWVIVSHHHPVYSVALGRDNPRLREQWQPIYERHRVDLVLQGHDHAYGRGQNLPEGKTVVNDLTTPVYVVSVAGPKQYLAADSARSGMQRIGEDVQLYQVIRIEADRLSYESRTAANGIYDAFDIEYPKGSGKRVVSRLTGDRPESHCKNPNRPRPTRCWEGTELVD